MIDVSCSHDVYCMRETDKHFSGQMKDIQNSRGPAGSSGAGIEINRLYQKEQQDEKGKIPQDLEH